MRVTKRIMTLGMLGMFLFSIFAINTKAAGNYTDTTYKYQFSDYTPYAGWNTECREKRDYTSSYMKCNQSSGRTYTAWVCAGNTSSEFPIEVGSPKYTFSAGTTRYMVNYVKERGYNYARIQAWPSGNGYYYVEGLWSPDSI